MRGRGLPTALIRVRAVRALCLGSAAGLLLASSSSWAASPPCTSLVPEEPAAGTFRTAGESRAYCPSLAPGAGAAGAGSERDGAETDGTPWVLEVEQRGVDVALRITLPGERGREGEVWTLDSPLDRDGLELALLPPEAKRGPTRVEVRAVALGGGPGSYELRLRRAPTGGTRGPRWLEGARALTRAGRAYAGKGGAEGEAEVGAAAGRRRAILDHWEALDAWREAGEARLAAQSLYSIAVLHRLLGEAARGLKPAREVLPLWEALGDAGRTADTHNEIGLDLLATGDPAEARTAFRRALAVQQGEGDLFRRAATENNLCLAHLTAGELEEGARCYGPALEHIRAAGDADTEAVALTNLGRAHDLLGRPDRALDAYGQALALHRSAGREAREAEVLNQLGLLRRNLGEPQAALGLYLEALEVFRRVGDRRWEGLVLHNLGTVYQLLGDPLRARTFYRQTLDLWRELEDESREAGALKVLGQVEVTLGRPREARALYRRAAELEKATGDRDGAAFVELLQARAHHALGEAERALPLFTSALGVFRELGNRRSEAEALLGRGRSLTASGRPEAAAEDLEAALDLARRLGQRPLEGLCLYQLAEAERARGRSGAAEERAAEAIRLLGSLREGIADPDLGATFTSAWEGAFELQVDLRMERAMAGSSGAGPFEGPAVDAALEASDRGRAWGVTALLESRAGTAGDEGVEARRALRVAAGRREALRRRGASEAETARAETDFFRALSELELREAGSAPGTGRPPALSSSAVRGLLDPEAALVELALGERRSFLFLVTVDRVRAFRLPGRAELEGKARRLHAGFAGDIAGGASPGEQERIARELSDLLARPVVRALAGSRVRRLAWSPDGALHYLPLAALPLPREGSAPSSGPGGTAESRPLLTHYEVVHLPSAAALAAERKRHAGRAPAAGWAAVLADPVFSPDDLRLAGKTGGAPGAAVRSALSSEPLARLRASRREAEAIAGSAPRARDGGGRREVLLALDFEADRELLLSGRLAGYRIVHLATHGRIDERHPALSELVLSRVDRRGAPKEGAVRLQDLYALRLNADLAVLSACSTALGTEVRGEGLMGLTRGLFHAGARRVAASLWDVPDRSTAELMSAFYRHLSEAEEAGRPLSPAAALRRAQLDLLAEPGTRDPRHWAGFMIFGDWRGDRRENRP